jgi:hypothetical protein
MRQKLVVIAEYRDLAQASLAQSTLETQGIQCYLADQYRVGINWLYSTALDRIKLKVPECDAVWANEILCRFEHVYTEGLDNELAPEATCLHCGSTENITKNATRKLAAVSLLFSLTLFFFLKRKSCIECGNKLK